MGKTNAKGEIPFGHDLPFDLIGAQGGRRTGEGAMQIHHSDGRVVIARIVSHSAWVRHRYTKDEVEWIAVFDATTDQCFYSPAAVWDGQVAVSLRLMPTINGQAKGIRFASSFRTLIGNPHAADTPGSVEPVPLPLDLPPE